MHMCEKIAFLKTLFGEAVAAADPALVVPPHLPAPGAGRTVVFGAGKASAAMARAVEDSWQGDRGELSGLVVTRYGHAVQCSAVDIVEAAHPVPDEAGLAASARMLEMAQTLGGDDVAICLISGGGSALLCAPAGGITFADKQKVNDALLRSGAPIDAMNTVRKHLSAIKGGRLAAAIHPATAYSLIISDVPGDDPATVASGPTVADPTTRGEALAIIDRYALDVPRSVRVWLGREEAETPKPTDARLTRAQARMIATPALSLARARAAAEAAGYAVLDLGDRVEGEAREVGRDHGRLARRIAAGDGPLRPPCVILSGGETTVTVTGCGGRGGRNSEYLLAMALELDGLAGVWALAGDTDGIDGSEDNAGAVIAPDTLARARVAGVDAAACLAGNDAYTFFAALGDLVVSGPTLTNVNDFRAIVVEGR